MQKKMSNFSLKTYLSFRGFVQDLRKDERGLSGVVVTVLLILIAVLIIAAIWGALSGWIEQLWDKIIGSGGADQFSEPSFSSGN